MPSNEFERADAQNLARSVQAKTVADIQSIDATNPQLMHEWIGELKSAHEQSLQESKMFQEAIERLCSAQRYAVRDIATPVLEIREV